MPCPICDKIHCDHAAAEQQEKELENFYGAEAYKLAVLLAGKEKARTLLEKTLIRGSVKKNYPQ
jgi:hypothetical protein